MKKSSLLALSAVSAGLSLAVLGVGVAQADPNGTPTYRQLAGVGSDTTQDVMGAMSDAVTINGVKVLGSYNATGSSTITTKDPAVTPGCTINRPNGSGAGRTALLNSLTANDGCLQWSRSSKLDLTTSTPSLTYIPYAIDAVAYAVTDSSAVPRNANLADLQAMYHCDPNYVGTAPNWAITPILPQAGSGTRSYWEGKMGILDADVNSGKYPCILNGSKNGQIIEEHTGTALDDKSLLPFSIAQYNDQANGLTADRRGRAVLGSIGTGAAGTAVTGLTYPNKMNPTFNVNREVYNVIPTSMVADPTYSNVFVGSSSQICSATGQAVIEKYGFALDSNCGSTSNHS